MPNQPHREPTRASAEHGEVMLDGPDGLATSMTPEAARHSAKSIAEAAEVAAKQTPRAQTPQ